MEEVKKIAYEKIENLGIEISSFEELDFFVSEAEQRLKNLLSCDELPTKTYNLLSEMVAGFFIKNHLILAGEFSGNLSSIRQGDVSMKYRDGTSLWEIAQKMSEPCEYELSPFRRILW